MRFERRLTTPRWLVFVVPIGSLIAAFAAAAIVLLLAGKDPLATYERLFDRGYFAPGALARAPRPGKAINRPLALTAYY